MVRIQKNDIEEEDENSAGTFIVSSREPTS